jgi:glycolate oxidase FAD binding subunit
MTVLSAADRALSAADRALSAADRALSDADRTRSLQDQVRAAVEAGTPLTIRGGDTKRFLGRQCPPASATTIDMRPHAGIVHYDPSELVLTARCGTPLEEVELALAARGQMLPCEPPHFGVGATFGGMVAAGLSGPRRPWSGAVRDFVLGCRIIDGRARAMRFGGEVIKNVAGYDVSRLLTGSFGCLALLTEVSMKVLPKPLHQCTLRIDIDVGEALRRLAGWAREPLPITAACHDGSALHVRLEGGHGSVEAGAARLGGRRLDSDFWVDLREHRLPFFDGARPLWRLSLPAASAPLPIAGELMVDWAGAQHWLKTDADAAAVREAAARAGGSAIAYRRREGPDAGNDAPFHAPSEPLLALHRRLKGHFDPRGLFNPGRLYSSL